MLAYSFAEVAYSGPSFYHSAKTMFLTLTGRAKPIATPLQVDDDEAEDPAPPHEQIPTWHWLLGLSLSSVGTLVVGKAAL